MELENTTDLWNVNLGGELYDADFQTLCRWIAEGRVPRETPVRKGGLDWIAAGNVPALKEHFDRAGAPRPQGGGVPAQFKRAKPVMTGLSGNEMYCLHQKGFGAGSLVIGNSVYSLGLLGSIGSSFQGLVGGEVTQVTNLIHEGRLQSFQRMVKEAESHGGTGITGVTNELRHFQGNIEFLTVASTIHHEGEQSERLKFSTACDGQELYCMIDAGYLPMRFVFGNVAYSIGVGGGLMGGLKSLGRGEIKEFSNVFNATRHLALQRVMDEAKSVGANAVVGVQTTVKPFQGVHEMMMTGTAALHPGLPPEFKQFPSTSDLTCQEMWNLANMGFIPIRLVLGTAVYSLGFVGGLKSLFKSFVRGEISDLTSLIYEAREHAIGLISAEAEALGADDVVGIKTHIHEMGNLIEFMAIGTAVKRHPAAKTLTATLPPQAVMKDKDTWISEGAFFRVGATEG